MYIYICHCIELSLYNWILLHGPKLDNFLHENFENHRGTERGAANFSVPGHRWGLRPCQDPPGKKRRLVDSATICYKHQSDLMVAKITDHGWVECPKRMILVWWGPVGGWGHVGNQSAHDSWVLIFPCRVNG